MVALDFDDEVVADGYRLHGTAAERRERQTIRRLSPRLLFVEVGGYQCTVALGTRSALIVDPLDAARAAQLVELVRTRFGLEVSAVVYSHAHADHVSGTARVAYDTRHPEPLAIHAVSACAENVVDRARHPAPTDVHEDGATFEFEDIPFRLSVIGGHTADSTLILFPADAVAHAVDLVHPGQAEFFDLGGTTDVWSYERALELLIAAPWRVLTAGHGQLGWPDDVRITQEYLRDLRSATEAAVSEALGSADSAPDVPNARVAALRERIRDRARPVLIDAWAARLGGLEYTVDSHIGRMADDLLYFG